MSIIFWIIKWFNSLMGFKITSEVYKAVKVVWLLIVSYTLVLKFCAKDKMFFGCIFQKNKTLIM